MALPVRRRTPGTPVSRLVAPVIWRVGVLVPVMAVICVLGVLLSTRAVDDLIDGVEPVARAHQLVGEDIDDLELAVSAWARTGDADWRTEFTTALDDLAPHIEELEARVADAGDLEPAVAKEIRTAQSWLDEYARPRIVAPGGPDTFVQARFDKGRRLFSTFRGARSATESGLDTKRQESGESAILRFRATIVAALLIMALSWILVGRARTRLLSELSAPLLELEKVVQRMTRPDPDVRANAELGPKEVRAIAVALNDFADAQSRARAVEGRIQDELHVLDSAKDDFVSNVSHELRTPLTTIAGYLEIVADEFEGQLEPRHERILDATRRNVVRLRTLIDDLLALSKAEQLAAQMEPSDVSAILTDAAVDVRMTAARRSISVAIKGLDSELVVVADRPMLYRAFLNVLTNAVKFSHDGGTVEVTVARFGPRVEIRITDHGIGIPSGELDRLGTRFFRASNAMSNEIAGTGLGLRIVQTIIDTHAGDVVLESTEGAGTTVLIRLWLHQEGLSHLLASGGDDARNSAASDAVV
ncbi:MAG: HAMP domain-containing sensor histidine kinase [Nocardioides sp.]